MSRLAKITKNQRKTLYYLTHIKNYDLHITAVEADILIKQYNKGIDIKPDLIKMLYSNNSRHITA